MGGSDKNGCRCFAKCCGICCCLVVVVLGVMIPVGIKVIAPKMAQQTLDEANLVISNGTLYNIIAMGLYDGYDKGFIANNGTMSSSFPLGATVMPFEVTLSAIDPFCTASTGPLFHPGWNCSDDMPESPLAKFMFPQIDVNKGINKAEFTANLTVLNASSLADIGLAIPMCKRWDDCISYFGINSINVTMSGSPTLKVGPISLSGLKIEKHLQCIALYVPAEDEEDVEEEMNAEVIMGRRLGNLLTVAMECREHGSHDLPLPPTTTLPPTTLPPATNTSTTTTNGTTGDVAV